MKKEKLPHKNKQQIQKCVSSGGVLFGKSNFIKWNTVQLRETEQLWKRSTYLSRFQFILQIVLADAFVADSQPPRYFLLVLHESTHTPQHHSLEVALLVVVKKKKKKRAITPLGSQKQQHKKRSNTLKAWIMLTSLFDLLRRLHLMGFGGKSLWMWVKVRKVVGNT